MRATLSTPYFIRAGNQVDLYVPVNPNFSGDVTAEIVQPGAKFINGASNGKTVTFKGEVTLKIRGDIFRSRQVNFLYQDGVTDMLNVVAPSLEPGKLITQKGELYPQEAENFGIKFGLAKISSAVGLVDNSTAFKIERFNPSKEVPFSAQQTEPEWERKVREEYTNEAGSGFKFTIVPKGFFGGALSFIIGKMQGFLDVVGRQFPRFIVDVDVLENGHIILTVIQKEVEPDADSLRAATPAALAPLIISLVRTALIALGSIFVVDSTEKIINGNPDNDNTGGIAGAARSSTVLVLVFGAGIVGFLLLGGPKLLGR